MFLKKTAIALAATLAAAGPVRAETVPVLVPITGFLSLEGTAQRNSAAGTPAALYAYFFA